MAYQVFGCNVSSGGAVDSPMPRNINPVDERLLRFFGGGVLFSCSFGQSGGAFLLSGIIEAPVPFRIRR